LNIKESRKESGKESLTLSLALSLRERGLNSLSPRERVGERVNYRLTLLKKYK
jgi:hypothetical protein